MRRVLLILVLIAATTEFSFAQTESMPKGDIEYGEYLSSECVTCHQASGADKGIPSITGWHVDSFISVIKAYKAKDLDNPAMQLIAGRLDDEQIASLALYFGSLPARGAGWD